MMDRQKDKQIWKLFLHHHSLFTRPHPFLVPVRYWYKQKALVPYVAEVESAKKRPPSNLESIRRASMSNSSCSFLTPSSMPRGIIDFMGWSRKTPNNEIRKRRNARRAAKTPKKKQRLVGGKAEPRVLCDLSSDTLHHVFGFFLSDAGTVDGGTLRSIMLVSKQWNEVATCSSLWKIQKQNDASNTDPIESALSITEVDSAVVDPPDEKPEELSLVGFTKMDHVHFSFGDDSVGFRAKERSRGIQCILAVSRTSERSNLLLNHIFEASFFQGGLEFMAPGQRDVFARMQKYYPLGVILVGDYVVRWYEDGDDLNPVLPPRMFSIPFRPQPEQRESFRALVPLAFDHRYLQYLESRQKSEVTNHLSRRCWAMIVDWLVEITQCFTLRDRVPFHAMDLFHRFVSNIKGRLNVLNYQLTASACMSIACKCDLASSLAMKATDFVHCSDNLFTAKQLSATEDMVLVALDWKLAQPVIVDFTQAFEVHSDIGRDRHEKAMMNYLSELALQSQVHADLKPSLVAACVAVFARYCLQQDKPLWRPSYDVLTGYTFDKVCSGVVTLSQRLEEITSFVPDIEVIDRRYRTVANTVAIPTITSSAVLIAYQARMTRAIVPDDS